MTDQFIKWAIEKLKEAVSSKMYGGITFQFQNGVFTGVKIEKTERPPVDVRVG